MILENSHWGKDKANFGVKIFGMIDWDMGLWVSLSTNEDIRWEELLVDEWRDEQMLQSRFDNMRLIFLFSVFLWFWFHVWYDLIYSPDLTFFGRYFLVCFFISMVLSLWCHHLLILSLFSLTFLALDVFSIRCFLIATSTLFTAAYLMFCDHTILFSFANLDTNTNIPFVRSNSTSSAAVEGHRICSAYTMSMSGAWPVGSYRSSRSYG